ncbi:MAG: hypothetical protein WC197_04520 [Candidatus Gastranaerophilaceae bacterium]|jgi:hypothetical protein
MLHVNGKIETAVNSNAYTGPKKEYSKTVQLLNSLDKDQFCLSGEKKISSVNNVSFCGKQQTTPHDNPYVLVHGTIVKDDSLFKLRDVLKPYVHSIDLTPYPMLTNGEPLEKSAREISKNINKSRISVTQEKLEQLKNIKDNHEELKKYFGINTDFCGVQNNGDVNKIVKLIPNTINEIEAITKINKKDLLGSFSTRIKEVKENLAANIKKTDFGNWNPADKDKLCDKVAEEMIDTIAPKAVVIGHSMGGTAAHLIAVNPKKDLADNSPDTYDAGNGVSTFISLSSPVEQGVKIDSDGMKNARYDWVNENWIKPFEDFYGGLLSVNPGYEIGKALFKGNCRAYSNSKDIEPIQQKLQQNLVPGLQQITRDSEFMKKYFIGKSTAKGVSSLSYYHPDDNYMTRDSDKLNEAHANNHNMEINLKVKDSDLKEARAEDYTMIRTLYAHDYLAKKPEEYAKIFEHNIISKPNDAIKMLDISNSDTLRHQCLDVIYNQVKENPAFLKNNAKLLAKIEQVCAEKIPFESSPSFRAGQILEINKKSPKVLQEA